MVPTLTENCLRQPRHVQSIRVLMNETFLLRHRGHSGPFGHFALATVSRQIIGSEKYRIACTKPAFSLSMAVSIKLLYHAQMCESSDLLPFITRIACANDQDQAEFETELQEHRAPSPDVAAYPLRLIL